MRRQRADGTWTFTTEDWDRRWYWTVGTRLLVRGAPGRVVKVNRVTLDVEMDDGRRGRVGMPDAVRLELLTELSPEARELARELSPLQLANRRRRQTRKDGGR